MPKKRTDLKLSYKCNNNCIFCSIGKRRQDAEEKETEEIKRLIEESREKGFSYILFTGGEPTIRKDIFELVEYAKKIGFKRIQIESNGRMLAYQDFCRKLIESGANCFSISLHTLNEGAYEKLSNLKEPHLKEVLYGISNITNLCKDICINTIITKLNYKELPIIARELKKRRIKSWHVSFVCPVGNAWINRKYVVPSYIEAMSSLHEAIRICKKEKINVTTERIPLCFMQDYKDCIFETKKMNKERVAPDLFDKDFNETRKQANIKGDFCKKCIYFNECEGIDKRYIKIYGWKDFMPVKK